MTPLVSVIVPVYNVEPYLHKCVDSINCQTYSNLEIILVDDGSTDGCGVICDDYAKVDSRIRVIHKENGGPGSARNSGLNICTGEYVMFVDSDDYLCKDAIQVLYERIVFDDSDLVIGRYALVYDDEHTDLPAQNCQDDGVLSNADVFKRMEKYNSITVSAWGKLYKKSRLHDVLYTSHRIGEDMWVFPLIVNGCQRISLDSTTVYYYYQRRNSLMKQKSECAKYDHLDATLHTTHFLYAKGYRVNEWYSVSIEIALTLKKRSDRLRLFRQYFNRIERKQLLKCVNARRKIKWFCLHVPYIYYFRQAGKKIINLIK